MEFKVWPHTNSYIEVRSSTARNSCQNKVVSLTRNKNFLPSGPCCVYFMYTLLDSIEAIQNKYLW